MSKVFCSALCTAALVLGLGIGYLVPHHQAMTTRTLLFSNPASDQALLDTILRHEYAVVEPLKRNDIDAFGRMLPEDIVDIEDDGIHDKADWLQSFRAQKGAGYLFHDFQFINPRLIRIGESAAVYYASEKWRATSHGKPSDGCVYTHALYIHRGTAWLPRLYQDTPASAPGAC